MTASDGDLIGDEAVEAYVAAATAWSGHCATLTGCDDAVRAGLAAALPHLTATCDALRTTEAAPTQSHQPAPERRPTAATGALNDVPQQNPNQTVTTQED